MKRRRPAPPAPLAVAVGAVIKHLRDKVAHLTLEELGAAMEPPIARGQLSKIENGAPRTSVDRYQSIAAALGTTADALFRSAVRQLSLSATQSSSSRRAGRSNRRAANA